MKRTTVIWVFLLSRLVETACCGGTNVLIIPKGDTRAGAIFFVDECLTRGLTNSISITDLRKWATNTIQHYRRLEASSAKSTAAAKQTQLLLAADVPDNIRTIQTRIPSCRSMGAMPKIDGWDKILESYSKAWSVSKEEAEARLRTIGPHMEPPTVGLRRSSQDAIEAVTITWYLYGVIVGPESFKPEWDHPPWYHRKLTEGIYLWHGYK